MEVVSRSAETETADHDYNTGAGDSVQLNTAMQLAGRLYLSYIAVKVASYQWQIQNFGIAGCRVGSGVWGGAVSPESLLKFYANAK